MNILITNFSHWFISTSIVCAHFWRVSFALSVIWFWFDLTIRSKTQGKTKKFNEIQCIWMHFSTLISLFDCIHLNRSFQRQRIAFLREYYFYFSIDWFQSNSNRFFFFTFHNRIFHSLIEILYHFDQHSHLMHRKCENILFLFLDRF